MISARQCRAARAWLDMTATQLAKSAGCSRDTIRRFEGARHDHRLRPTTDAAVRGTLEANGVRFVFSREGDAIGIEGSA